MEAHLRDAQSVQTASPSLPETESKGENAEDHRWNEAARSSRSRFLQPRSFSPTISLYTGVFAPAA
jgi:hypothetical protein